MAYGKITRAQAAILGAYTGILCGPFEDMHEYIEQIMGRPVFTHELASDTLCEEIKEKAKQDFLAILP
jgi:hypothetical protein